MDSCLEERTVDVHIRRLRQKLMPSGHGGVIETVRGLGYRFNVAAFRGTADAGQ
jgi:DNA-binding response OmpR family regulator